MMIFVIICCVLPNSPNHIMVVMRGTNKSDLQRYRRGVKDECVKYCLLRGGRFFDAVWMQKPASWQIRAMAGDPCGCLVVVVADLVRL